MAKTKKKTKKVDAEALKSTVIGWQGGMPVDVDRVMESGKTLRVELTDYVDRLLTQEIENQADRLEAIARWQRMYKGVREPRNAGEANVATPLMRSGSDAIFVRIMDAVSNKQKLALMRALTKEYSGGLDREIEDAFEQFQRHTLKFKDKVFSPLLQCVKTGTGVLKLVYEDNKTPRYRYANEDELNNPDIHKYALQGTTDKCVKVIESSYKGPNIYPIPREDWVQSSESYDLDDAQMCGFKTEYRKPLAELRVKQGLFDKERFDEMFKGGEGTAPEDEVKAGRAENQKLQRKFLDENKPFNVWELWLKYDVDEDGEEDEIVVHFNLESKILLKTIYCPIFTNKRPFQKLIFYRQEYAPDGEGVCEVLENTQEELDTMHNQRIDRIHQINRPILFVRSGSGLENLKHLEAGKIQVIDGDAKNDLYEFRFSDVTYSAAREEQNLLDMGYRAIGVTPVALGVSTAERPVAKQELILREETNKKFKMGIDNVRDGLIEIIYKIFELFMQNQPTYTYNENVNGEVVPKKVTFPIADIRNGLKLTLFMSTEMFNQETRQQGEIMLYHMMSDYYQQTAEMVKAILTPGIPSDFKKFLIKLTEKRDIQIEKIVRDFNEIDAEEYKANVATTIDVKKALAQSIDTMPPQPPGQPGQPLTQGGQPPSQGQR